MSIDFDATQRERAKEATPPTVVFVLHYAGVYGANLSMLSTAKALSRQHGIHPVFLVPGQGPVLDALKKDGFRVITTAAKGAVNDASRWSRMKAGGRLVHNALQVFRALRLLRHQPVDLVYVNSLSNQLGLLLAHWMKKPFIVHLREYGWEDYGFRYDFESTLLPRLLARSSKIVCISADLQQDHLRRFPKTPSTQTTVIYNGIGSMHQIQQLSQPGVRVHEVTPSCRVELGLVGYIAPNKGHETALKALALLTSQGQDMRLHIFGEGPDSEVSRLKALADALGVGDRVIFRGHVNEPEKIYAELQILLMCSKREAMGRVTAEAMSRGLVVVGHSAGATRELISHGVNGFLYEGFDNAEGLAAALRQAANPEVACVIRRRAHQDALNWFTTENNGQRVFGVIRDALQVQ